MSSKRNTKSNKIKKSTDSKKVNPHAKRLKLIKKQQEQLKKQKEEEERLRLDEEEKERIYQEQLKIEEENRQKKLQDRQKQRELNKKKKEEEDRLKQRVQAYAKYGINMNTVQKKDKSKKGKQRLAKKIIEKEEEDVKVIETIVKKVTSSSSSSLGNWDDDTESKSGNDNKNVSEEIYNYSYDEESEIDNDMKTVYRSPVCCVLGHVNAGKTSLLDKIRSSNIQGKEIGGITQQIGGTMITKGLIEGLIQKELSLNISGLLIIDTPGHKTFSNLRKNGVQICDFAILVVDMFKGIEDQTIESIKILQENNIPYIIALNKMDMISEWVSCPTTYTLKKLLANQNDRTLSLYNDYINQCIYNFAEHEINVIPYYKNKNIKEFISIVPVSSLTGEGLSDMFLVMLQTMKYKILNELSLTNNFNCKILEINKITGYGLTPTVILIEGTISLRDTLYFVNKNNELVACKVKSILLFESNKEVREEKKFTTVTTIGGTCCCKIICTEVEQLLVGVPLYNNKNNVIYSNNVIEGKFDDIGVSVHASTLGALESFVTFLNESNIPIAYKKIGEVTKKDVIRAQGMITKGHSEYATILCFDIEINHNIINYAFGKNVSIFTSNIIHELEKLFQNFFENKKLEILESGSDQMIYPCSLKILPEYIIHDHNPISLDVFVQDCILKNNTPICTIKNDMIIELEQ